MTFQAWLTATVIAGMMTALASNRLGAHLVMLGALGVLLAARVIDPGDAVAGVANEGLLTVACLYVVVAGLRQSGVVGRVATVLLGRPTTAVEAQWRVVGPVTALSAFVNNTPLVAVYLPLVSSLARRAGVPPSQLFLPLSYAAILGGVCTLVGTSTNVVVNGLLLDYNRAGQGPPLTPFGMFTLSPVGVPVALAGVAWMLLAGRRLLPARVAAGHDDDRRDYMVALRAEPAARVVGLGLEAAGLRHLTGLFLAHIERRHEVLHAVGPDEVVLADDVLVFVGVRDSVVELHQIPGLVPVAWDASAGARHDHRLIEAVIAPSSPMVGHTIRDGGFRTKYGGVIVAVHRKGERLAGKLGDIRLRGGDAVLIEAPPGFAARHEHSPAFHLVSGPEGPLLPRHHRAWVAAAIFLAFVVTSAAGWLATLHAALLAAVAMLVFGCTTLRVARQTVDWPVLVVIGAGIGVGKAVEASGLAAVVADAALGLTAGGGPVWLLAGVYALTWALTSVLSNTAAAVLVFPVALRAAQASGVAFEPLAMAIAMAASCEFTTPIGYQTNLMVQGPGGYRLGDYLRFGGPLTLICGIVAVTLLAARYY
jgi:di/tricarboxylate transporter